ncbi:MAG: hypothetical protein ACP5HM_15085 [Anaerolineae bacterium]
MAEDRDTLDSDLMRAHTKHAREYRRIIALLIGLGLIIATLYLQIAFTTAKGRPVAPLDDAYITFQYARQIAKGHIYQYNTGDPPTTGMTSMLYGLLVALLYKIGFTGESLASITVALGIVWLATNTWLTYHLTAQMIADRRGRHPWALLAALMVLLSGAAQWSFFNGMETGLFTTVTLAALYTFVANKPGWCAVWLSMAGMTRPEGLLLTGAVLFGSVAGDMVHHRRLQWPRILYLSAAILPGLLPSAVNWALTGSPSATGFQAKAWLYNVPAYPKEILHSITLAYRDIVLGSFLGWDSPVPAFTPPGLLLFMLLAWFFLGSKRRWKTLLVTGAWFFGATLANAMLITSSWHVGRYQVPLLPLAFSLAISSLAALEQRARRRWQRVTAILCALYLIAASLHALPDFIILYRRSVRTMANQQLVLADWIRGHLPEEVRVGVHDTGSLRYVGERPTYDLVGLTTPDAAEAWRHGAGSVYELMENSPLRPAYFAIYPNAFSIPYLASTDLFAEELLLVDVPYAYIASAEPVQGIWKADWSLANSGTTFHQPDIIARTEGLEIVDALDVADLEDEAAHGVRWWQRQLRPGFPTEVHQMTYRVDPTREVIDGGRLINGGLTFQTTAQPGRPLWLVARLHAHEGGAVFVKVNGEATGRWAWPQIAGEWLETLFEIPPESIDSKNVEITLEVDSEVAGALNYAPYHLWVLQGEFAFPEPEIDHPLSDIHLGDHITLLGFDLATTSWQAGNVVPLTLYWSTDVETNLDAKTFVHLYDSQGSLITQADGRPYFGTRPPYTWRPGEIVEDPITLSLPSELPPGRYPLKAGLYHPDNSGRIAAYQADKPLEEERIPLIILHIE